MFAIYDGDLRVYSKGTERGMTFANQYDRDFVCFASFAADKLKDLV
jgi:hypothetical protein